MTDDAIFSIYVLGKEQALKGLGEKIVFTQGRIHTFFMLVKNGEPLTELHFTAKTRDGKTATKLNALNMMQSVTDMIGLGRVFGSLVQHAGLNRHALLLKAIETRPRQPIDDRLYQYGMVQGSAQDILSVWNRVCGMALEINRAEIPFTHNVNWGFGRKPANCQAAAKTVLNYLGSEFNTAAKAIAYRHGRLLDDEVPALANTPIPHAEDQQALHEHLKYQLFKTSGFRCERS